MRVLLLSILVSLFSCVQGQWQAINDSLPALGAFCIEEANDKLYFAGYNSIYSWDEYLLEDISWSHLTTTNRIWSLVEFEGTLIAGGQFYGLGSDTLWNIARYDGSNWHSMDGGLPDAAIHSLLVWEDTLYAAGHILTHNGSIANHILKWNGNEWVIIPGFNGWVWKLYATADGFYAGGGFYLNTEGDTCARVAKFNGHSWDPMGQGFQRDFSFLVSYQVLDFVEYQGALYASGFFNEYFPDTISTSIHNLAKWNGTSWEGLPVGLYENVWAMDTLDNHLILGGEMWGDYALNLDTTIVEVRSLLGWDGAEAYSFSGGTDWISYDDDTEVFAIKKWRDHLYIGGNFELIDSVLAVGIAVYGPPFPEPSGIYESEKELTTIIYPNPIAPGANLNFSHHLVPPFWIYDNQGRMYSKGIAKAPSSPGVYYMKDGEGMTYRFIVR